MLDVDYRFRPRQVHALLLLLVLLPCVPAAVSFRFMMESLATERAALTERAAAFYGAQLNAVAGALQNPYLQEFRVLSAESSANELVLLAESRGIGALWPRDLAARGSEGFRKSSTELEVKAGEFVAKAREGEWMELEAGSPWMACLIRPVARPAGVVLMRLRATMVEALEGFANAGFGEEARIRLLTPQSEGSSAVEELRVSTPLGAAFPSWRLEADIDPEKSWMKDFEANAQTYFYAALAIAAVILGISSLTAFEVNRQLRRQASQLTSLAVLAHELKTPIASSRILLEGLALRDEPSLETIRDYTGLLLDENERLGRTVQNLLAFAKFERDPSAFRPTTLNLSATVRESLAQVRHRLVEPDTLLREELPIEDSHVNADARMVEHALGNLLDNAVKHTPAPRRVSVTLYETAQSVELAVSDDGPGIPKAKQQEIFEPFRQGNDRLDRTSEGCGLGLAIVREVMRLHRGRVDLVSTSGGGSRFVLHFPKS